MNANSIPASAWMVLEILSDLSLESRVRAEFAASIDPLSSANPNSSPTIPTYDVVKLCASPLLQSIYAETLRVRVAIMGTRETIAPSLALQNWSFQKGDVLTYASSLSALDKTVWNTGGEGDPHPLGEFWADRFLVYPGDGNSGPLLRRGKKVRGVHCLKGAQKPSSGTSTPAANGAQELRVPEDKSPDSHQQPQFSLGGLSASWIPYGGGLRLCPGRHFAKQEMLVSTAVWLSAYDIELKASPGAPPRGGGAPSRGHKFEVNKNYFGFGTMPPKGKIAARIRRRGMA
jgi:cytochrome P450